MSCRVKVPVVLMVGSVEKVGEEAFLLLCEPESFGKRGQRHLEETQRVFEHNISTIDGQAQNLGSIDDLLGHDIVCKAHPGWGKNQTLRNCELGR